MLGYQLGEGLVEHPKRISLCADQLLIRTAPWGVFALGAGDWAVRRFRRRGYHAALIPAAVLGIGLAIMALTPNRRAHYLLPLLPMWALMLGGFLDRAAAGREAGAEPVPRYVIVGDDRAEEVAGLAGRPVRRVGAWRLGKSGVILLRVEGTAGGADAAGGAARKPSDSI